MNSHWTAQQRVFGACRSYVEDLRPELGEALYEKIHGWVRSRSFAELADAMSLFDPDLHRVEQFRVLRQIGAFFKKNAIFANNADCVKAARQSFFEAEATCAETNRRLTDYYFATEALSKPFDLEDHYTDPNLDSVCDAVGHELWWMTSPPDPRLLKWVNQMARVIHDCLGPVREFNETFPLNIRVTAGATSTLSRRNAAPHRKVSKRVHATETAGQYLEAVSEFFGYGRLKVRTTDANRVTLVPKNWKTHRTIACEPTGNIPCQLACDTFIKKRLIRTLRIDLRDQSRNQKLAYKGSVDGTHATIDLKQASDTVAYELVNLLFPHEWVEVLEGFRCRRYEGVFQEGTYEKFSSMGNGSTFVIETLVFAAACRAVGARDYSVYGDDIVIETELVEDLTTLLEFLGFAINTEKSFTDGPFRESCGYDWYEGEDVTPFYVRSWGCHKTLTAHNVNGLAGISRPFGRLWHYLRNLWEEDPRSMPRLVPFNGSSISGVWVDVHTAYTKKLIRNDAYKDEEWVPRFKAMVPKEPQAKAWDTRTLFLWHLRKYQGRGRDEDLEQKFETLMSEGNRRLALRLSPKRIQHLFKVTVSSGVTTLRLKYSSKWVRFTPVGPEPSHLHWWSMFLTRELPI